MTGILGEKVDIRQATRHLDLHFAGLGWQLPLVAPDPGVYSIWRALLAPGLAYLVGFGVHQFVQCLLDSAPNHLNQMPADLLARVNSDNFAQWFRAIFFLGGLL